ncbi:MAG: SMP-30/gluconolactonase/LRE family protein [Candidatus Acidiferrales bacterium]
MNRLKRVLVAVIVLIVAVLAYLAFWPVPIYPVSWQPEADAGYTGPFAPNDRLTAMKLFPLDPDRGPETIAADKDNRLYTGVYSGKILRINPDGSGITTVTNTGGRVMGIVFDPAGKLVVADALKGILSINPDGTYRTLIDGSDGPESVGWFNSVAVANNGNVYGTVPGTRFHPARWGEASAFMDIVEHGNTGKVYEFNPTTGARRVVAHGFHFTNGITVSQDQQFLFVAESGGYRVWKIAIQANDVDVYQHSPDATVLLDNLPGFPDNITRGLDGRLWLGVPNPRNPVVDKWADHPTLRKILLRLPEWLSPVPKQYGHVVAFNEDGSILVDLQDPTGKLLTMGATETPNGLYIQSQRSASIGYLQKF